MLMVLNELKLFLFNKFVLMMLFVKVVGVMRVVIFVRSVCVSERKIEVLDGKFDMLS